jgi:hypothetical protein
MVVSRRKQLLTPEDLHDDDLTNDGEMISFVLRVLFELGGGRGILIERVKVGVGES